MLSLRANSPLTLITEVTVTGVSFNHEVVEVIDLRTGNRLKSEKVRLELRIGAVNQSGEVLTTAIRYILAETGQDWS